MEPNEEGSTRWHHPRTMEDDSLDEDVSEGDQAQHRAQLGAVLMDEWVDAVYPTTRCYFCQACGHMARECPAKGKGKGGMKGGGKKWRRVETKEAEKEGPKEEAARVREKGTERAKG